MTCRSDPEDPFGLSPTRPPPFYKLCPLCVNTGRVQRPRSRTLRAWLWWRAVVRRDAYARELRSVWGTTCPLCDALIWRAGQPESAPNGEAGGG